MNSKIVLAIFFVFYSINVYSQNRDYPLVSVPQSRDKGIPEGWVLGGSNPFDYSAGLDLEESYSGFSSAYLKALYPRPVGFVTMMQSFKANNYRSQRIRLTAYVKTRLVSVGASLWMRVNDAVGKPLAFDDMRERPLIGSMDWTMIEIVLDVPPMSDEIAFGFLLQGKGQVWVDEIKISMVGQNVPVTDILNSKSDSYGPKNLNFEE